MLKSETATAEPIREIPSDSTVAQTIEDVKRKAEYVKLNKDGKPRKKYTRQGSPESVSASPSAPVGTGGFTENQIKATFQGGFALAALSTNCNVWLLADSEADCFVPSATVALNQTFPSVANSKWGAITLASLSLGAVVLAKTLVYFQWKAAQKAPPDNGESPKSPDA